MEAKKIKIEIKTTGVCGWGAAILVALWEVARHLVAEDFKANKQYKIKTFMTEDSGCEYLKLKVEDCK